MMGFALECSVHFLREKRTKLYEKYYLGVPEWKNVLSAKNDLQERALLVLERRGA